MKIMTLSDLHLGKTGTLQGIPWSTLFEELLRRACERASKEEFDVFLFMGDAAEKGPEDDRGLYLRQAIELLARVPIHHKLWVAGNNDIECLPGDLGSYVEELSKMLGEEFLLLDEGPVYLGDKDHTAFVGSVGWYDGSLWRGEAVDKLSVMAQVSDSHKPFWKGRNPPSPEVMFKQVQDSFRGHIEEALARAQQLVVCSHFVPDVGFCKYGHSEEFDYRNWFMGYDGAKAGHWADPRVTFGLTGHTHRDAIVEISGCPVINVSGIQQPRVFELPE